MSKNAHVNKGIDFTGFRNGKLTVISKCNEGENRWICHCDCGKEIVMIPSIFKKFKSCGCLNIENRKNLANYTRTHGMTNSILYSKYCGMKERCYNPNYRYYNRYGGRGIIICDEWLGEHGFENFKKWAYENGYDDNKHTYQQTLDRVDVDGDYDPNNCRWVDQKTQTNNRSICVYIDDNGEYVTLSQFAEKHNIDKPWFVRRRFYRGKTANEILEEWNIRNNWKEKYMTLDESAEFYGVSKETIMIWVKKKMLNSIKYCSKIFIPRGQVVDRNYEDRNEKGQFLKGKPKK